MRSSPIGEQTIEFRSGHAIAFAGSVLQALAIDDRDDAALITDQAFTLQGARSSRNACALHPQHHGQELLGEQKFIRIHTVVRHQQPAATSLLQRMKMIARGRLRDLVEEGVSIAKHAPRIEPLRAISLLNSVAFILRPAPGT